MTDEIISSPSVIVFSSAIFPLFPQIKERLWILLAWRKEMTGVEIADAQRFAVIRGGKPVTDEQIAKILGYHPETARKARHALVKDGFAVQTRRQDGHTILLTEMGYPFWEFLDPEAPGKGEHRKIGIKSGLLDPVHVARMGKAVWLFLWLVDGVTYTMKPPWLDGEVKYSAVVSDYDAAWALRCSIKEVASMRLTLIRWEYILAERLPKGHRYWVRKSRKIFGPEKKSWHQKRYEEDYRRRLSYGRLTREQQLNLTDEELVSYGLKRSPGSGPEAIWLQNKDDCDHELLDLAFRSRISESKRLVSGEDLDDGGRWLGTPEGDALAAELDRLTKEECRNIGRPTPSPILTHAKGDSDPRQGRFRPTPRAIHSAVEIDATVIESSPCDGQPPSYREQSCTNMNSHEAQLQLSDGLSQSFPAKDAVKRQTLCHVWKYYIKKLEKDERRYHFTDKRQKKGLARLAEALVMTGGNLEKAGQLMECAIDGLASSPWHTGNNPQKTHYDSWEKNLFGSQEQFERWLEVADEQR